MSCHRLFRSIAHRSSAILAGVFSLVGAAAGQSVPAADIQRQVDDAFREVIAKADSVATREKYARLLVQAENFEGGIAALEGLLLAPDAPVGIRLELAYLYFRLGSYAMSEAYLREALADPRLGVEQKKQAETLLIDVGRRNQASVLTGSLMAGLRAQSNPRSSSSEARVLSAGNLVPRADKDRPKSAVDGHLWGKLDHSYDLGAQNEATVVTTVVGYANHFSSVDSYAYRPGNTDPFDVATIVGSSGIRFKPSPVGMPQLTLRPHLLLGHMSLNGHKYFSMGGLGLDSNYRLREWLTWGAGYEARHFSFASRPDIIDASRATGTEQSVRLRSALELGTNRVIRGELGLIDRGAELGHLEFKGTEAKLAYAFSYADPAASSGQMWTTTLTGSALQRRYRAADPAVDANTRRRDTEWRLSLVNSMPLTRDLALQAQLEYTQTPSNLPNYEYSNLAGSLGVMWKF